MMNITKNDINYLSKTILVWTFLNFTFNLIGLWITKLIDTGGFNYLVSISNEFVQPLLIQSLVFVVVTSIAFVFLKNKKITIYIFTLFQTLIFNLIFVGNLKSAHMIHFETSLNDTGLKYLSNMGQYLVDILYIYVPLDGIFRDNIFIPKNTGVFYFQWIFLVLLYFAFISYLTPRVLSFFTTKEKAESLVLDNTSDDLSFGNELEISKD